MDKNIRIAVLSGAGISAESGVRTFRDSGGLWEQYSIEDVATPEAWRRNPELVLRFYNERRAQLDQVKPNAAHLALANLEQYAEVQIITQNVDDLHERGGSSRVLHLHGELRKARGEHYPETVFDIGSRALHLGDLCPKGSQLRPHIVWFGEEVPLIEAAVECLQNADYLLVVGTSLTVYPASGLFHEVPYTCEKILIDPGEFNPVHLRHFRHVKENAGKGVPQVVDELIRKLR